MLCVISLAVYLLLSCVSFFFFKQKTAYEMRISDWSSDVCSSDLPFIEPVRQVRRRHHVEQHDLVHRLRRAGRAGQGAAFEDLPRQGEADETGSAGDDNLHVLLPLIP